MNDQTRTIKETKASRVWAALMEGLSFNRFEAARELHDHCLHSTVAELQQRRKVVISREFETVAGYMGNPTRCCRYWLSLQERQRIENRLKSLLSINTDQADSEQLSDQNRA